MQLTLTPLADAGVTVLPPDIVWNGTVGDFRLAASAAEGGAGGLVGRAPLATAVILCLFTDGRAGAEDLRPEHHGDRRGWPGDGFDLDSVGGQAPLGSLLWLFRRRELNDITALEVQAAAEAALQPLIAQGAAVAVRTQASVDKAAGRLSLGVGLYGRDGAELHAAKFDLLWQNL